MLHLETVLRETSSLLVSDVDEPCVALSHCSTVSVWLLEAVVAFFNELGEDGVLGSGDVGLGG